MPNDERQKNDEARIPTQRHPMVTCVSASSNYPRDIRISDVSGRGIKLTTVVDDVVLPSPLVDTIIAECQSLRPVLVVIDPAISFGIGEARVNDAEQGLIEAGRRIRSHDRS